jgi:hypothetical protein
MAKKTTSNSKSKATRRTRWLDPKSDTPLLKSYARQMQSFIKAVADGVVEKTELEEQEKLIVALMKEIEPKLEDELHEKVTRLLCEISVYDMMQLMMAMQDARPVARFKG